MPLQLFSRWFFGLAADFIWPEQKCCMISNHDSFQNFKLPGMVLASSVLFHTYTWPLIEAFGTPCSFSDCTGNVLFGCRYWCGVAFWEKARNSVQRGTASFSWYLLAIEQCREKKDQRNSLGSYRTSAEVNFVVKICSKWLFFWSTCINPG